MKFNYLSWIGQFKKFFTGVTYKHAHPKGAGHCKEGSQLPHGRAWRNLDDERVGMANLKAMDKNFNQKFVHPRHKRVFV